MGLDFLFGRAGSYLLAGVLLCAAAAVLFAAGYFLVYKKALHGQKTLSKSTLALLAVSFIYLVFLACAVLLDRDGGDYVAGVQPLFSDYRRAWYECSAQQWRNIALNILLFVPFGFLLPFWKTRLDRLPLQKRLLAKMPQAAVRQSELPTVLFGGFFLTLVIEALQQLLQLGVFSWDDILNNTLGTLLGYCALQIVRRLHQRQFRRAAVCLVPFLALALIFGGLYVYYLAKPYGNLAYSYYDRQNMENVQVQLACELSEESALGVYRAKAASAGDARARFLQMLQTSGAAADLAAEDAQEDFYMADSSDGSYHFSMDLTNGTYDFQNEDYFQPDSDAPDTAYTEQQVRAALRRYAVEPPRGCTFRAEEDMGFEFSADLMADTSLQSGSLYCCMFAGGVVGEIDNGILDLQLCEEQTGISQSDALQRIREGRFGTDAYLPDACTLQITGCTTRYLADSKLFYRPVYLFDAVILAGDQSGETLLYVPA